MARGGVAAVAVVALVLVVVAGAAVTSYIYLVPSGQPQHTTTTSSLVPGASLAASSTTTTSGGSIQISNAALSNNSLLVTVQNTGSVAVSVDALTVAPGTGCSLGNFTRPPLALPRNLTALNQTSGFHFSIPTCLTQTSLFLVQKNSTLIPLSARMFNFTSFNSTTFSGSANFSGVSSGNFSRFFGNSSNPSFLGNLTSGIPGGFLTNLTEQAGVGFHLAAGRAVTLEYSGPVGAGVTTGSPYTITVAGLEASAQTTVSAN